MALGRCKQINLNFMLLYTWNSLRRAGPTYVRFEEESKIK